MQQITVATDAQRRIRQRELAMLDEKEAQEREEARKNKGFTQYIPWAGDASLSLPRAMQGPSACTRSLLKISTRLAARWSAINSFWRTR